MKPAISIQNLSKKYKLQASSSYVALRDVLTESIKNVFKPKSENTTFWALKDIDLDIQEGERVGIIGHNGAGKSTLLKIISRITPPTTGKIILNGRVASLLEVGTGFHPELTGRENIYLNGSILGLRKVEIDKKLDEIIDFSGVEKFIDSPLKHYSSGMELRLAFSVAAHLEAEILLIDEVLAVGDMEFQKKSIGKMDEISRNDGKTILFVSHNLGFVQQFCNKSALLKGGKLIEFSDSGNIIDIYLNQTSVSGISKTVFGNGDIQLKSLSIVDAYTQTSQLFLGYPAKLYVEMTALKVLNNLEVAFNIRDARKDLISHVTSLDKRIRLKADNNEVISIEILLEEVNFTPGTYSIDFFILNNDEMCWGCEDNLDFTVLNSDKAQRPDGFPSHVKVFTKSTWTFKNV